MRHRGRMRKRKGTGTKVWTEREARQTLAEQRKSGMTVAAFAKKRGLVPERLYWWQRKLKPAGKVRCGTKQAAAATARAMEFAEVVPMVAREGCGGNEERFEVLLSNGRRVLVPRGFAAPDMQRLVAVLEAAPC